MREGEKKYDIIVVGAGISGVTIAERCANVLKKKVLVIEKRDHVGGNCYDYFNEAGVLVPKYGPHFFHTNFSDIWEYVSQFTNWHPYEHRVLSKVGESLVPIPVNIETVNKVFDINISSEHEMVEWLERNVEKIENPKNSEESALGRVGKILYEKMFKNYTKKQWDLWPHELDASVMDRIPVRTNFDDRYFTDKYQGMPSKGYTKLFERMLANPNIDVRLGSDYFEIEKDIQGYDKLFFTGKVDDFLKEKISARLQYRSLNLKYKTLDTEYFQERAQINYPNENEYTRITEPKHATGQINKKTTIIMEYPTWDDEPYYPVPTPRNQELYDKFFQEAQKLEEKGIYFVGRLANYKYFNMDQAFKNALDLFYKINF
jgi:UDP-galactopyranose mutase